MVDGEGLSSTSPKGYRTTATVLHMATPAGWTKNGGERSFIDALQKLMNAGSPTLTGPGGALILGLFVRTEDKGLMEPEIEQLRKEYPIGELAEFRHIARMRWEAYAKACNEYEGAVTPEQGKLAELRVNLGRQILADLMPYVLGIDPTGNDQEPCATCSGRGCLECGEKFSFTTRAGEEPSLEEAVFQALGAASACWENLAGAGIFNSTRAKEIGDYLKGFLLARLERAYDAGKKAEAEKALKNADVSRRALEEIDKSVGNEVLLGSDETTRIRGILFSALGRKSKEREAESSSDMDLLEEAYGLLCSTSQEDADSYAPGWSAAFESFKESYHRRLDAHVKSKDPNGQA